MCSVHKTAVEVIVTLPATTRDVGEMVSTAHTNEKVANQDCDLKFFKNSWFLAWQGITLRGDGDKKDSNFMQLTTYNFMWLCYCDNPAILKQLRKNKYAYQPYHIKPPPIMKIN